MSGSWFDLSRWWRSRRVELGMLVAVAFLSIGAAVRFATPDPAPYQPAALRAGKELVMVFIASSSCKGIKAPGLPNALENLKKHYRSEAKRMKANFVTVAVSLDWSLNQGVALLNEFAPWDEIAIGRSWLNSAAVKYIWKDLPGGSAVPQVILVERDITIGAGFGVNAERVLVRRVGAGPIMDWAQALPSNH